MRFDVPVIGRSPPSKPWPAPEATCLAIESARTLLFDAAAIAADATPPASRSLLSQPPSRRRSPTQQGIRSAAAVTTSRARKAVLYRYANQLIPAVHAPSQQGSQRSQRRNPMLRSKAYHFAPVLALAAACTFGLTARAADILAEGAKAPNFSLPSQEDSAVSLRAIQGQVGRPLLLPQGHDHRLHH